MSDQSAISQVISRVVADFRRNRSKKVILVDGLIAYSLATAAILVRYAANLVFFQMM